MPGCWTFLLSRSAATAGGAGSVAVLSYALISFGRPQELPILHSLKELSEVGVKFVPLYTVFIQRESVQQRTESLISVQSLRVQNQFSD